MTRPERLLALLQALRRHRRPVRARQLADELEVSERTIYRDIATLRRSGADIAGEAGVGFVLREGFMLPPLMFTRPELDALMLGLEFVLGRGDPAMRLATRDVAAKLRSVLPGGAQRIGMRTLIVGPPGESPADDRLDVIWEAVLAEQTLAITYRGQHGAASERIIWPIYIAFMVDCTMIAGWCELRADFRNFRLDRIEGVRRRDERFGRPRAALLHEWRRREGVADQLA